MASHRTLAVAAVVVIASLFEVVSAAAAAISIAEDIGVTNPSAFSRSNEPSILSFKSIGLSESDAKVATLYVLEKNRVVPSEIIDTDGDGKVDALLMVDGYTAKATHHLSVLSDATFAKPTIKKQTQAEISIKQGGQWQDKIYKGGSFVNAQHVKPPAQYTDHSNYIRYEGPGIESDKVAYRVYLDQRNGFDIFGKKVPDMVLQNIGHDDGESYENDAAWGLDILKVGDSLGAGGFGYWNGAQVKSIAETDNRESTIVANGNLYSAFNIQYHHWKLNDAVYEMSAMISMHAGSRLAHTQVSLTADGKITLPTLAIGVVKHPNTKLIQSNNHTLEWGYAASWGKQSRIAPNEYLGMAVIFHRAQRVEQTEDANSYVAVMDTSQGALDYYLLAAWDKEPNGIKSEAEFKAYLDNEIQRLSAPLKLSVAKSTITH